MQNQLSIRYTKACWFVNKNLELMKTTERIRVTKALLQLDSDCRQTSESVSLVEREFCILVLTSSERTRPALAMILTSEANERLSMVSKMLVKESRCR